MGNDDPNPAYRFLQPHHYNYVKAMAHALQYSCAVAALGGIDEEESTRQTSVMIDLLDELWDLRAREAERQFGTALTTEAIERLKAEDLPPAIQALSAESG